MAIGGNILRELFVEGVVETVKNLSGKTAAEGVTKAAGRWFERVGRQEDLDENWYDQGVATGILGDKTCSFEALFTREEYEKHLARVRVDVHREKQGKYRIYCIGYKKDEPGKSPEVDPKETARIVASHVRFSDTGWKNYVATHDLDRPLIATIDLDEEVRLQRSKVKENREGKIGLLDSFKWFSLP